MAHHRKATLGRIIRPLDDYGGALTRVAAVAEDVGVDALIRAIDKGVPVYSAGPALLTEDDVPKSLRTEVAKAGSQSAWANRTGANRATVNAILHRKPRFQPKDSRSV